MDSYYGSVYDSVYNAGRDAAREGFGRDMRRGKTNLAQRGLLGGSHHAGQVGAAQRGFGDRVLDAAAMARGARRSAERADFGMRQGLDLLGDAAHDPMGLRPMHQPLLMQDPDRAGARTLWLQHLMASLGNALGPNSMFGRTY